MVLGAAVVLGGWVELATGGGAMTVVPLEVAEDDGNDEGVVELLLVDGVITTTAVETCIQPTPSQA